MRIITIEDKPFGELVYRAAAGGGRVEAARFPLIRAKVDCLPMETDALFVCSDLQGVLDKWVDGKAIAEQFGVILAEQLYEFAVFEQIPDPQRIGVILCGDLYTIPSLEKRGGSGDVCQVWLSFARYFR